MASNLERVGVLLVADGIQGFLGLMADAGKAVVGFLGDSIDIAGDFEQTMNLLGAVSEATAEEIGLISDKAKALGADLTLPATSAVDAGNAMLELSKAGFTVQQTMDAAKGVLQLAAAATIDEAKAAEIAANAINAFGLAASDATFVADLLAATANASSVEITDVADSYKMAGAVFSNFQAPVVGAKQAMVDLTTAVGLLGNAGIKGSDAGTSLKQALLQLTGPSKKAKGLMIELARSIGETGDIAYTADGQMRSFPEILGLVSRATKDLTDEKRNQYITDIFGADASRAILILMRQGPDAWAKMEAAVTRQGAAADLAAAQTKGYKGALEGAKSQIETLQLAIGGPFLDVLAMLLNTYISPGIAQLTAFASALLGNKEAVDALNPTLATVLRWLQSASAAWGYWEKGIISTRTALDTLIPGLGDKLGPALDTVIGLVQGVIDKFTFLSTAFQAGGLSGLIDALAGEISAALPGIQAKLGEWGQAFADWVSPAIPKMIDAFFAIRLQIVQAILGALPGIIDTLGQWATQFGAWVVKAGPPMLEKLGVQTGLLLDTIGAALPGIVTKLATWGAALVQWVIDKGPVLIQELANLGLKVVGWLVERLPGIMEQLGKWGTQFVEWVGPAAGKLIIALGELLGKFMTWFVGAAPDIKKQLDEWGLMMGEWVVTTAIPALLKGLAGLASTLFGWISDKAKEIGAKDSIGSAIVDAIKSGISKAWGALVGWFQGKLKELTDQLPFSEPKDHSSPLYGLGKTGEAIVAAIQGGISAAPQLIIPSPVLPDLNELISGVAKDAKKGAAKAVPDLGTLIPDTKAIMAPIADMINIVLPEKTLKMLEQLRHKMALLDPSDIQSMNALATMIEQATAAGRAEALDAARVSPPASAAQMAAGAGAVNNTRTQTINMPIHTNMTPTAITQSMAIIAASMP